jgi:hypothetical protein
VPPFRSSRLPAISDEMQVIPIASHASITMGIVLVASLAALIAWSPFTKIVSPRSRTSSATSSVPTFAKAEPEGCRQLRTGGGRGCEPADSIDLPHLLLLRFRGDRRKSEADSESDREPDQSHGAPRVGTSARESS